MGEFTFAGKRVRAKRVPADQPVLAFNPFDEVHGETGAAPAGDTQDRGIFLAYTGGGFVVVDEPVDLAPANNGHASDFLDRWLQARPIDRAPGKAPARPQAIPRNPRKIKQLATHDVAQTARFGRFGAIETEYGSAANPSRWGRKWKQ